MVAVRHRRILDVKTTDRVHITVPAYNTRIHIIYIFIYTVGGRNTKTSPSEYTGVSLCIIYLHIISFSFSRVSSFIFIHIPSVIYKSPYYTVLARLRLCAFEFVCFCDDDWRWKSFFPFYSPWSTSSGFFPRGFVYI